MTFCIWLRSLLGAEINYELYLNLFACLLLVVPLYTVFGLYPPILVYAAEAVRLLSQATTSLFLVIFAITFFLKSGAEYSRLTLLFAWLLSLLIMPVWRGAVKRYFSRYAWWGNKLILCGGREWLNKAVAHLCYNSNLGLKPCGVVILDENGASEADQSREISVKMLGNSERTISLPVLQLESMPDYAHSFKSPYALIDLQALSSADSAYMGRLSCHFKKTFFVFPFLTSLNCWTGLTDLGGYFVLETRQKLLDIRRQYMKRVIDLLLTFLGAIVFISLTAVIAVLIKWEDGGPVFFAHRRIGKGGKEIRVLKFRTMLPNAEEVLAQKLAENPDLAKEWAENHKLKNDPRITGVGRWLRKTSLDELPQVWNVLKGELSFVGPRPIVNAEIEKYGDDAFDLYKRVLPGLTGYWQISGRSSTTYKQRVQLDSYYIRNWSVWLDIYIIACTPRALLRTGDAC
ncbi:MAG: undecaprenyl-phosphate galactose phosphotransferase WbaP [Desulfovibrionaceae bacterium]|nr:undecaprenyl-phosphate galactose phosphotransferase WbaP [Desulfovibrionaceae bacterium]